MKNNIPNTKELSKLTGESEQEIENLVSNTIGLKEESPEKTEYRKTVLSNPRKVKLIRIKLKQIKSGLDLKLSLLDSMYKDIEDNNERDKKIEEERMKVFKEYTDIELSLFTTRQNGMFIKSKHYEFKPNIGLNRMQRRKFRN